MNLRKHLFETATLVIVASICALVANTMAGRERKLAVVGSYESATGTRSAARPADTPQVPMNRIDTNANSSASTSYSTTTAPIESVPATSTTATTASQVPPSQQLLSGPRTVAPAGQSGKSLPAPTASPKTPAQSPATTDISRFQPHEKQAYIEIAGDDVAALHAHGSMFLDARRTSVYQQGHIPGARPFSVWESDIDEKVSNLLNEARDQKQPIVIYCSGGDCEDSHMLAQKLWGVFFSNIYVYKDGFPDWQKRGGAVHQGAEP